MKVRRHAVLLDTKVTVAKETSSGQIPGRVFMGVFEKIQEFSIQQASTTESDATKAPAAPVERTGDQEVLIAKGNVRIVNKYSRAQTLVKTTRLLTSDGKLYRIDKQVVIPSGGEVSVSAYADQPGAEFAIGPSKCTIPGLWIDLQKFIYAESDAAFTAVPFKVSSTPPVATKPAAAAKSVGPLVRAADVEDAYQTLTDVLLGQAKKQLLAELNDPRLSGSLFAWKVLEKKSNVSVGQRTDTFLASLKLEVTMVAYAKEDMIALVRSKLKEKVPDGREILPFQEDGVTFAIESADVSKESASVKISANAVYRLNAANPLLQKSIIAGKTKVEAERILKAVEGVEDASVTIAPRWMSKIPALQDRIELKIE